MAQIRKRGESSYQITIYLGRDSNGKKEEYRETFYGSKPLAKKYADKLEIQMKEKIGARNNGIFTIDELFDFWLDGIKDDVYERTYEKYEYHVRKLRPILGHLQLFTLTSLVLKQSLKDGIDPKLSDRTKKDLYTSLRTALNYASSFDLIREDMMKGIKAPKQTHKERKVLNLNELKVFLDYAKEYKHYIILRILSLTGLRIGEAMGLKWQDIDFESNTIQIVRATNIRSRELKDTKTVNSPRIIEMDDETMTELKQLKKTNKAQLQDLVFNEGGRPLRYNAVRMAKERVLTKAGLRHVRLHDLRHGVGSIMLDGGAPLTVVASALGQKPATTAQTYSHALRKGKSIASLL